MLQSLLAPVFEHACYALSRSSASAVSHRKPYHNSNPAAVQLELSLRTSQRESRALEEALRSAKGTEYDGLVKQSKAEEGRLQPCAWLHYENHIMFAPRALDQMVRMRLHQCPQSRNHHHLALIQAHSLPFCALHLQ